MRLEMQKWKTFVRLVLGCAVAAWVVLGAPSAEASGDPSPIEECACTEKSCSLVIRWGELESSDIVLDADFLSKNECFEDATPRGKKITEAHTIHVTIKQFNFLKYEIKMEQEVKSLDAYQQLNTLWTQILGLGGVVGMSSRVGEEKDLFLEHFLLWETEVALVNRLVDEALEKHESSKLSVQDVADIRSASTNLGGRLGNLEALEREAVRLAVLRTFQDDHGNDIVVSDISPDVRLQLVRDLRDKQEEVVARVDAFQARARRVELGGKKVLKGTKAGSLVKVIFTAVERNEATEDQVVTVRYFVASSLPVVFHGGYGEGDLSDFEFEKVRTADGLDAFDLVKDDSSREEFMVFLSIDLITLDERDRFGLLATLGTGLEDPGDTLFAGVSLKLFERFFLSYGQMSAEVAEGVDPFVNQVGQTLGTRELFSTIDKRRDWGDFWGVSFLISF